MATADNLKIAQQLLATMQQITVQVEKQTEAYHAQAQLVDALCKAQECFGKIDAAKVKEVTDALREAQEKTKEFGKQIEEVAEEEVGKLEGAIKKIAEEVKKISVPAEFLNGFKSGLNLSTNLFKNILSMGGSAFGLLKDIGGIFLSLPGRLLDFFQGAAGSGTDEYRVALEELRKEFGDLQIGTSASIKSMTESTKSLGSSGLALSRVFGYGRAGLAAMLRENMALIKEMGPLGNRLAESIKGAEGEFTLLRKATAISGEAFKSFQLSVEEAGGDGVKAVRDMTKSIAQFTREFGISSKEYGRDLDFMMKDTQTFGIMAPKEMLKVSTYVKKLGISMESLKKVVEKSLNFEDAAEQAAKLSEAFNIQIDAMKQMKETDPTKKLDNIRQAFFKTGRSIEQMTVQERRYLSTQLDMSEADLRTAFSQKNRALSGAALDAQMKKSRKTHISQEEAMQNLAKSIERLVQSGSAMKGSFFEIFFKGFERGIRRSKEFREVVRNLQRSLRQVYWAGRDVGRMFIKEFPGIKEMLKGLAEMFDPKRFRGLMNQVKEEFSKFFKTLQTDPKAGVQDFMKNMKKIFFDFFTKGAPAGSRFLDGLKTFYKTIGMIFVQGLRYALSAFKDILGTVIGFLRDPSSLKNMAVEAGEGISGIFSQAFGYVVQELGPLLQVIGGQIVELMKLLFEKYIKPHLLKLVVLIFGPALFMGIARAAGAALLKVGFEKVITGFLDKMPGVAKAAGAGDAASQAQQTGTFAADMRSFGTNMIKLVGAMAVIAVAIRMLMPIILSIAKEIENSGLSKESIAFTAVLIGIFGVLFIGLGNMVKAIADSQIDGTKVGKAIPAMVAAGVILAALVPLAYLAVNVLGKLPAEDIAKTVFLMTSFTILFGALGLLVGFMALEGSALAAAVGEALLGIAVAAVAMVAVGGLALLAVKVLGKIKMEEMLTAAATIGVFTVLFGAIGLLTVELAAVGAVMSFAWPVALAGLLASSLVMTAVGAAAIVVLETFQNVDKEKAETAIGIMESMVDLFAGISIGIGLLALAASSISWSGMAKLVLMLAGVATVVTSLISTAKNMLKDLGTVNIDESKAKAAATIMSAVGNLMKDVVESMASLALAGHGSLMGMIVGFDFSNSFGTIKDMLVGPNGLLNTIKTIVSELITTIGNIQGDPAVLKAKAEVFETIAKGISNMLPPLARLIEAISSSGSNSLVGILFGADAGALIGNLDKIKTFVEGFLDGIFKGPDGIVPKIADSFKNLSPSQVEGVKAGATLLGAFVPAIAQLTGSLPETIRAVTGLVDELNNEADVTRVLDSIKEMITGIITSMSSMLTSVIGSITTLLSNSAVTPEKLKAAESIGNILKGVSELAKMFVLTPDQLRVFREVDGTFTDENVNVSALGTYMSSITTEVLKLINGDGSPNNKGIKGIIEVIANMTVDENKIKGIQAVTSILEVLGRIIPSVMESIRSASDSVRDASLTPEQIQARQNLISTTIASISTFISSMMTTIISNVITSLQGLNIDTKALASKVNAVKGVFELINTITAITNSLKVTTTGAGGATTTSVQSVLDTINPPLNLLIGLFSKTGEGNVRGYGNTTYAALNALATFPVPKGIAAKATTIKTVFEAIKTLIEATRALKDIAGSNTAPISVRVLDVPLQNIDNVLRSLTSTGTSGGRGVNPLMDQSRDNPLFKLGGISERLKGKSSKLSAIADNLREMFNSATALGGLTSLATTGTTLQTRLQEFFGLAGVPDSSVSVLSALNAQFGDSAVADKKGTQLANINTNIRERILTPVRDMVQAYNDFSRELQNINSGTPLQITLDNLGARMGNSRRMVIQNSAVQATINVNVTMEVGDVVQALHYHTTQNTAASDAVFTTSAFNAGGSWNNTP